MAMSQVRRAVRARIARLRRLPPMPRERCPRPPSLTPPAGAVAEELLAEMLEGSSQGQVTCSVFTALFEGLLRRDALPAAAERAFQQIRASMINAGVAPDKKNYSLQLETHLLAGNLQARPPLRQPAPRRPRARSQRNSMHLPLRRRKRSWRSERCGCGAAAC